MTALVLALAASPAPAAQPVPLGDQFKVDVLLTPFNLPPKAPEVASGAAGNFVVVWNSDDYDGYYSVEARRYHAAGTPKGAQFTVSQVNYYEYQPKIDVRSTGEFVVAWDDFPYPGGSYTTDIYGRVLDASGTPTTGVLPLQVTAGTDEKGPVVAVDETGDFVVVWGEYDSPVWTLRGRRYDVAGTPQGSAFVVTTDADSGLYPDSGSGRPAVAADPAGNFVVAWSQYSATKILAQRYDATATPLGGPIEVTTGSDPNASFVDVDVDAAGNFVVAWEQEVGNDEIYARHFSASGTPSGPPFHVNTYTARDQRGPSVAFDGAGNFVVTWDGYGDGEYPGVPGIFGRRYLVPRDPDHYKCYRTTGDVRRRCFGDLGVHCQVDADCTAEGVDPPCVGFPKEVPANLADQWETLDVNVTRPIRLCPPVDKNGEGIADPALHTGGLKHVKQVFFADDQYGRHVLQTQRPDSLLVPTAKQEPAGATGDPGLPAAGHDHYKCHRVKELKRVCTGDLVTRCREDADCQPSPGGFCHLGKIPPKGTPVSLVDQIESRPMEVKKLQLFCRPVDKNGEGIGSPDCHLVGYRIKAPRGTPKHVKVANVRLRNQFGLEVVETRREETLFVPATKNGAGTCAGVPSP